VEHLLVEWSIDSKKHPSVTTALLQADCKGQRLLALAGAFAAFSIIRTMGAATANTQTRIHLPASFLSREKRGTAHLR
jgi:hypothetical protein